MGLDIIGVGLCRTGTFSTKTALELLGHSCLHRIDVLEQADLVERWAAALDLVSPNFVDLFQGWTATMEFPGLAWWRELTDTFADAKIVLTERPSEEWYASLTQTVIPWARTALPNAQAPDLASRHLEQALPAVLGFDWKQVDRDHAISMYLAHNAEVKATFAPERLLVWEVSHGWDPLCEFLEVAVPDVAFPQLNTTQEYQQRRAMV